MPRINGEPEPTRFVDEDEISFSNRHFDWRGRNQYPLPPAPPLPPDPTITPSYPCDFGAFDFVGQMISFLWWAWQRVVSSKKYGLRYSFIIGFVDRMFASTISYDSYGQSSFHELWLGVWLVYGIVVAAWTASSWSKHWNEYLGEQYKPKRKANGEQMLMLGDLFEGYEGVDRERGTDHTLI